MCCSSLRERRGDRVNFGPLERAFKAGAEMWMSLSTVTRSWGSSLAFLVEVLLFWFFVVAWLRSDGCCEVRACSWSNLRCSVDLFRCFVSLADAVIAGSS